MEYECEPIRRHADVSDRPENCPVGHMYCLAIKITRNIGTTDIVAGADTDFVGKCTPALRLSEFVDNRHMKVVRLLAILTGRFTPQEIPLVLISDRG
jgi:hypothetical protein